MCVEYELRFIPSHVYSIVPLYRRRVDVNKKRHVFDEGRYISCCLHMFYILLITFSEFVKDHFPLFVAYTCAITFLELVKGKLPLLDVYTVVYTSFTPLLSPS